MAELKTRIGKLRAALIAIEQVNGSQLANEALEADDADNEPMPVDLTNKQISAGLAAARASVLSFEFGDGSTAAQREAAYVAAFRAATCGVTEVAPSQREKDMALMLKRMCRRLEPTDNMREAVTDYLRREGLLGSPLRADDSGVAGTLNDQGEKR